MLKSTTKCYPHELSGQGDDALKLLNLLAIFRLLIIFVFIA
jgi:hypothetical protein